MGKGRAKNRGRRSASSLPRGIPQKKGAGAASPFELARAANTSRAKHHVHNKLQPGTQRALHAGGTGGAGANGGGAGGKGRGAQSALAKSIALRQSHLRDQLSREGKANEFVDRRIGEAARRRGYDGPSAEEVMLRRIVQERVRRSKKRERFNLDGSDDEEGGLTHRGQAIDQTYTGATTSPDEIHLSDDDDDDLDKVDTMLHFGGGKFDRDNLRERGAYGGGGEDMGDVYRSRKEELEERIRRKKVEKAEKMKRREDQVETFEAMDESFADLAHLLQFRDKEQERVRRATMRREGKLSAEDVEMDAWDKEMKEYLFERKVKATDRTKTAEEVAKEEADRLHALESKRLARMAGDFLSEDEFSDVSDDEDDDGGKRRKRRKKAKEGGKEKKKRSDHSNPEEMSDSDDEAKKKEEEKHEVRFTAEGLVYVDKEGNVVGKVGEEEDSDADDNLDEDSDEGSEGSDAEGGETKRRDLDASDGEDSVPSEEEDASSDEEDDEPIELKEGTAVQGNYRVGERYGASESWHNGTILAVRTDADGKVVYDVTYDDGDFEEGMAAEHVRPVPKSREERRGEQAKETEAAAAKKKKLKAKMRAKKTIPFVFEVPTTLDALHDLIGMYASTGADASLIIQRIHATNSVRLNHKNKEKMQNFYDVLLRRFIAVGDAIFASGDGGPDLGRYEQLNQLTKTLYAISQDSPECAGAVWSRRLGIFQKALSKRLRDVEVTPLGDACEDEFTAWPSTGMLLLMRALPHIFPSTDKRHAVVTPAILLLGQILAQTPIKTRHDVVMGLFCAGLMLEYTNGAKRVPPEATAYLAGVLRLFADDAEAVVGGSPLPSLGNTFKCPQLMDLRSEIGKLSNDDAEEACLSLERDNIQSETNSLAIMQFTLHSTQQAFTVIGKSDEGSEREIFGEILKSLLLITGKRKPLPPSAKRCLAETARVASSTCASDALRQPLQRRKGASVKDLAIKTLAPRMEDPKRYSLSKDKGKSQLQAEHDRNRREYKREHKAAMRELRLDSAFIENERRKAKNEADSKAREKRNKNYAWLEAEQATMNQQVRLGGGLLSGGGTGAAKAKAKSGKLGIKKGGKF